MKGSPCCSFLVAARSFFPDPHLLLASYHLTSSASLLQHRLPEPPNSGRGSDDGYRWPSIRLFWGSAGTTSYPLHQDLADGDIFYRVFNGSKRFALFTPSAAPYLGKMTFLPYPANRLYAHDSFAASPLLARETSDCVGPLGVPAGVHPGWCVTLLPGEVLYMPGDLLHHVVNVGDTPTLAVASRPWKSHHLAEERRRRFQASVGLDRGIPERRPEDVSDVSRDRITGTSVFLDELQG